MVAADPVALNALLVVQELDRQLDGLRHRRETLPEYAALAEIAGEHHALESVTAETEVGRHELERQQKRLEDEVALLDGRIEGEQGKLYGGAVTAMKELQALQEEIVGLEKRKSLVEDQILELMEEIEPIDVLLGQRAASKVALDARSAELQAALDVAGSELDAEITDVEARRAEHVTSVSGELLAVYDRLRSQPGRMGVARLVGGTCHGCHLELAAMEVDRLKKLPSDELVTCDECGCILVR